MSRDEFLSQLREALQGDLESSVVQENINYYNSYISEEVQKGKSEAEVLQMLGDPWILARTIIDMADGTDSQTVYESGGTQYSSAGKTTGSGQESARVHEYRLDTWWKKLLLILVIVMVVVLVVSIVTGVVRLLMPILIPVLIVMLIVRIIGNRHS